MIVDDLKNFNKYINLNPGFKKVAEFISTHNLLALEPGHHEIDGDNIYVNIDEYTTKTGTIPEAHRKYIDIQIVLKGYEKIGYAPLKDAILTAIDYDEERDIEFLYANCVYHKATVGKFFIFFPQDIHQPCITDEKESKIKKAVFKIKL